MINRTSVYHNFRSIFIPYFKYVGRGRFVPCDSEIQKSGAAICRYVIAEVKSTRHGGSFITKTFMIVHRFMSDAEYECLKTIKRKEYCCMRYDNKVANVMCATQKYRKYAEIRKVLKELGMI